MSSFRFFYLTNLIFAYGTAAAAAAQAMAPSAAPADHVFCQQPVAVTVAPRTDTAARYRRFLGIWSDAAWGPHACAALVVEHISRGGTARIVYAYGPMSADRPGPGGVLRGTGLIRNGALRFQDSDGTQFAFHPEAVDLAGRMTTETGETYRATFKKSF